MTVAAKQQKPPPKPKPHPTALEKSRRRADQNLQLGNILGNIADDRADAAAEVTADLLKMSAYDKASGELSNMQDKKGRVFTCPQSFISANTLLDANYQIKTSRRHQKRIYASFEAQRENIIEHGLDVTFLTSTFPNLLGVGFELNDKFQSLAWEKFLQTKTFAEFFYAGYSKTEWTLGGKTERAKTGQAFDLNLHGINYHCHALCINYQPFADGETSQLENKLRYMRNNGATAEEMRPVRNSLKVVKAWTKCLRKAAAVVFGKPIEIKTKSGLARFSFKNVGVDQIKAYDADESKNGIFWEIAKTSSYTAKGASFKDLPPELLLEAENVFKGKRMINAFGVFRKCVESKADDEPTLVNQPTKQSENEPQDSHNSLFDNVLRGKNEPLKTYGIRLCSQGLRETWLKYLDTSKDLIIANRREHLLERFPHAIFTDLSGKSYLGWKAEREMRQKQKELRPDYDPATDNYHLFKAYQSQFFVEMMNGGDFSESHAPLMKRNPPYPPLNSVVTSARAEKVENPTKPDTFTDALDSLLASPYFKGWTDASLF